MEHTIRPFISKLVQPEYLTQPNSVVLVAKTALCMALGYTAWSVIYNVFFNPLRKVPGPFLWSISPMPLLLMSCSSTPHKKVLALHNEYGDVVRTSPNSVSCLHAAAWKEVYGHRKPGQLENLKHPGFVAEVAEGIIAADTDNHRHQRHILAPSFSSQGMERQEPLIRHYVDALFNSFQEHCTMGKPIDLTRWFNFLSFDIIGDLSFGESFGNLERMEYHPWISTILEFFDAQHIMAHFRRAYPLVEALISPLLRLFATKIIAKHNDFMRTKVTKRLALQPSRSDFIDGMKSDHGREKGGLSFEAICHNASIFVVAGSETTANALCGVTYFLCTHPEILVRLRQEIDASFSSEEEITLLSVQRLKYLTAVLDETLRIYPAAVGSVPRNIQRRGEIVGGYFLPGGTTVDIWHWSMYHNPANFTKPETFAPGRWLGDPDFSQDKKAAFEPFSTGKRNCIGQNLAYAEMRQVIARLLWKYDIELVDREWYDRPWHDQDVHATYHKPPLNVKLALRPEKPMSG